MAYSAQDDDDYGFWRMVKPFVHATGRVAVGLLFSVLSTAVFSSQFVAHDNH